MQLEAISAEPPEPTLTVSGFLPLQEWLPILATLPDQQLAKFLERGIRQGFRIGFNPQAPLRPASGNVAQSPQIVDAYIAEEVALGRLEPSASPQHISPIGIIPKKGQPMKFRMIVDLSSPRGFSIKDGIERELCSLRYASVADAARRVVESGRGALMAKLDIKSAYRRVPVHPADSPLLGIQWREVFFVDKALPFGLRSAPLLFSAVADALAWAMYREGVPFSIHYLDYFFFCGPPKSHICAEALQKAVSICPLPVAPEKVVGPSTVITFLGIQIDSVNMTLSLPADKLAALKARLGEWSDRRSASKRQLQELLGHLHHAVRPGKTFTRSLIEAMKRPRLPEQRTRLEAICRADIAWWQLFVTAWNGISLLPPTTPSITIVSDASGSWGCGAFCRQLGGWFQVTWPLSWAEVNIAAKELLPITVAAATWGAQWSGRRILFLCDNMAAVQALQSRSARHPALAHLLRCLFFFEAWFSFEHAAQHLAGKLNTAADALSRNNSSLFQSLVPQAHKVATPIPPSVLQVLMDTKLLWTSPRWGQLFRGCLSKA